MSTEKMPFFAFKTILNETTHCFVIFNGNPITRFEVSFLLNRCSSFLGLQSALMRPHNFRIGACSMIISQHIPDAVVREMGRESQHSTAFQGYIRLDKIVA